MPAMSPIDTKSGLPTAMPMPIASVVRVEPFSLPRTQPRPIRLTARHQDPACDAFCDKQLDEQAEAKQRLLFEYGREVMRNVSQVMGGGDASLEALVWDVVRKGPWANTGGEYMLPYDSTANMALRHLRAHMQQLMQSDLAFEYASDEGTTTAKRSCVPSDKEAVREALRYVPDSDPASIRGWARRTTDEFYDMLDGADALFRSTDAVKIQQLNQERDTRTQQWLEQILGQLAQARHAPVPVPPAMPPAPPGYTPVPSPVPVPAPLPAIAPTSAPTTTTPASAVSIAVPVAPAPVAPTAVFPSPAGIATNAFAPATSGTTAPVPTATFAPAEHLFTPPQTFDPRRVALIEQLDELRRARGVLERDGKRRPTLPPVLAGVAMKLDTQEQDKQALRDQYDAKEQEILGQINAIDTGIAPVAAQPALASAAPGASTATATPKSKAKTNPTAAPGAPRPTAVSGLLGAVADEDSDDEGKTLEQKERERLQAANKKKKNEMNQDQAELKKKKEIERLEDAKEVAADLERTEKERKENEAKRVAARAKKKHAKTKKRAKKEKTKAEKAANEKRKQQEEKEDEKHQTELDAIVADTKEIKDDVRTYRRIARDARFHIKKYNAEQAQVRAKEGEIKAEANKEHTIKVLKVLLAEKESVLRGLEERPNKTINERAALVALKDEFRKINRQYNKLIDPEAEDEESDDDDDGRGSPEWGLPESHDDEGDENMGPSEADYERKYNP